MANQVPDFKTTLAVQGISPVPYAEAPGSPEESYSGNMGKLRRTFWCSWDNRWNFCQGMLGWSTMQTKGNQKYISRVPPQAYPVLASVSSLTGQTEYWLYATSVERIEGVGPYRAVGDKPGSTSDAKDQNNVYRYELAKITIGYESLPYRVYTDQQMLAGIQFAPNQFIQAADKNGNPDESTLMRYVSRTIQPTAEHLRLPFGKMFYVSDGLPAVNGSTKIISSCEVLFTWHQVPAVPNAVYTAVGTVNDATYVDYCPGVASDPFVYKAGTLLLTAVELKPYRIIGGLYVNDITYRMKYQGNFTSAGYNARQSNGSTSPVAAGTVIGHNGLLRFKNDGTYDYVLVTSSGYGDTGNTIYGTSDFTQLFKLP